MAFPFIDKWNWKIKASMWKKRGTQVSPGRRTGIGVAEARCTSRTYPLCLSACHLPPGHHCQHRYSFDAFAGFAYLQLSLLSFRLQLFSRSSAPTRYIWVEWMTDSHRYSFPTIMEPIGSPSKIAKKKRPSTVITDGDGVDLSKLRAHAACKNCRVKKVSRKIRAEPRKAADKDR